MTKKRQPEESTTATDAPPVDNAGTTPETTTPQTNGQTAKKLPVIKHPRDRFCELAPKRVSKALKQLLYVERLANRTTYQYTEAEADKIYNALSDAVKRIHDAFKGHVGRKDSFTL